MMKEINISRIITDNRRAKGITQEQLAAYMGVSKASVSKWETGQSYPDITFLPQLAAYFNITIDELMGYEPQMTKEDIKAMYHRLSADFANKPFAGVIEECRKIIRKYYSCFPLLMQMAILLCNHHMLAEEAEERKRILEEAAELCERIKTECEDLWLTREAASLEGVCCLMMNKPQEVLNLLGETIRPIANDEAGIAQAYLMMGNLSGANRVLQISMYQHLLVLAASGCSLLQLQNEQFEETLQRLLSLAEIFDLERLHPNTMALIYLNGAQGFCMKGDQEKALDMLQRYAVLCTTAFFPCTLHGDAFFYELDGWFEEFDLGKEAVRSDELIKKSMIESIAFNPAFEGLKQEPKYKNIIAIMETGLETN